MTKIHDLKELGQSIWFDFIRRSFTDTGELQNLLDQGVRGVTSNPSIFEKAIAGSTDYDHDLQQLVEAGKSVPEIYEALVIDDIQKAADVLRPIYDESGGDDGYVSLEVSPALARDTEGTIAEAKRLFETLDRPNVMIKIPATPEGVPAIEESIAAGLNINVTLIFSLQQYKPVVEAYLAGLERLAATGGDVSRVASVASFFVSRVDSAVDDALAEAGNSELQGNIAIDNAKVAYAYFTEVVDGERWQVLAAKGARVQRPLWASTGVKNPDYPDTLYVDSLIGPDTVNTVPPATLNAFLDHGTVAESAETGLAEARARLEELAGLGIDLDQITQQLQDDGVDSFAQSFEALMDSIAEKRDQLQEEWVPMSACVDFELALQVGQTLSNMKEEKIISRIWAHDHTVWKPDPTEITNRLGWLHSPEIMSDKLHHITALVDAVREAGYTQALLLGMGGSSLAPETFRQTFGVQDGYLDLAILDSTNPDAVRLAADRLDPAKTLVIVSTKSGGTVETGSLFKYFYNRVSEAVGPAQAGQHFVAITDPGSKLAELAQQYDFRSIFLNDPEIGGRYSALSYFGLVPAGLVGVDLDALLDRALNGVYNAQECNCLVEGDNHSARLGVLLGELARQGRDKVTLVTSPPLASFGDWVEQLIAESTGKEGRGILPVVGEPLGEPEVYGDDRFFVYLRLDGDDTHDEALGKIAEAGQPVVNFYLKDEYDLGAQFFMWEMATAVAGYRLGINPFDQPNVEAAKVQARRMVAAYQEEGQLPEPSPSLKSNGIAVYGDVPAGTPAETLRTFIGHGQAGAYIALQAYVQPTAETDVALQTLRTTLRDQTQLATTVGYGPRFLHSTGQLHKGDGGQGLFIQITTDPMQDVAIPNEAGSQDSGVSFGVLQVAQALGDRQALLDNSRRVLRLHLAADVAGQLQQLAQAVTA